MKFIRRQWALWRLNRFFRQLESRGSVEKTPADLRYEGNLWRMAGHQEVANIMWEAADEIEADRA